MAASVTCSAVVFEFLLVCPVSSYIPAISFTRDELLDIRHHTSPDILPVFDYSDVLLDIFVGGAAALITRFKRTRRRGKRAGALMRLRKRGFRTPLPSIQLANLRSLPNKTDELLLLSRTNKDFSHSAALCFTETWLHDAIPDSALHLPGFQLFRADRDTESTGKSRGGGTCFYINERWCTDVTVFKKMCCSDLETLFINCKPFYSPREFHSFILVSVYIPPQAHVSLALQKLADQITETEQQHPDSVLIILGDFNKANLSRELPKYRQHVTCPTRDSNILDHCYTTIKDAYHSVPQAALGRSDHCLVHLIPNYRQKLKSAKPVVRTVKRWTNEAEQDLQSCFDLTDWSVFEAAATDLDELTETVTSYISFCEDMCIPTRTKLIYNNDKPWFTAKLSQLRQAKEDAYRKGDNVLYKQAKYTLEKEIKVAKRNYSDKIRTQFTSNDSASVWKSLKEITNYKTPPPSTVENQRLADDLNEFYCRFERRTPITCPECLSKQPFSPFTTLATRPEHLSKQPPSPFTPPASPLSPTPAIQISEDAVRQVFRKQKRKKAPGPDCVTPACLKSCADQLAPIFTQIFNRSLELCEVPSCFKRSTIIPIPKKSKITGLNDYRPVALTSVVMKSFEKLVLAHLKDITGPLLDPLQFAYRANRSVDDAVNIGLHYVLQHLDRPGTYVRILFVDFSSAFNTIIPNLLLPKLTQLSVPTSVCQWINSFLTDRQQLVRLGKYTSSTRTISTGAPQGCVLSPLVGGVQGVSPEVHDHLHCFERVKLQVVKTAPDSQLVNLLSVSRLVTVLNEADDCSIIYKLQEHSLFSKLQFTFKKSSC
uniref:Reverse transcriptase domain-containing protein n=1 Tax=Cyprinus carpio carpio TaxID=630221 RepID=A0A9J8BEH4_CYPCA